MCVFLPSSPAGLLLEIKFPPVPMWINAPGFLVKKVAKIREKEA